jgi:hypothetical protein
MTAAEAYRSVQHGLVEQLRAALAAEDDALIDALERTIHFVSDAARDAEGATP